MSLKNAQEPSVDIGELRKQSSPELVDVDALRCFPELILQLGGDPELLLQRAHIDPSVLASRGTAIQYRSLLQVLQYAAEDLSCPDFALRLAALQGGNKSIGPIGVVMKNSRTLGQAIGYCAKNIHAYSLATRVRFEPDRAEHLLLVRLEILIDDIYDKRQAVEHALLLATLNILELTGRSARVRNVLFRHEPQATLTTYRMFFGCEVLFGQRVDGLILTENDLLCPVVDPDDRVYEMATTFIEARYPHSEGPIQTRVRRLVVQYLGGKGCTNERIAAELCLHPRTLQRRLRASGASFEEIKDDVRRHVALSYIRNGDMPLKCLAEKLGYAEASVLSRSCYRWFAASPRELRVRLKAEDSVGIRAEEQGRRFA